MLTEPLRASSGRSEASAVARLEGRVNGGETLRHVTEESGNHLAQNFLIATDALQDVVQDFRAAGAGWTKRPAGSASEGSLSKAVNVSR